MKTNLKHLFISVVICMAANSTSAQWVTIPDTNFVTYLQQNFASCMNGNQMDTTCSTIVNATSVYCSSRNIYDLTGIEYFDSLKILNCADNHLSNLPRLPSRLQSLSAGDNYHLPTLPVLPVTLQHLYCAMDSLTVLPALPAGLLELDCGFNQLTFLPSMPAGLTMMWCANNVLYNLPSIPITVTSLDCRQDSLTSLPPLPPHLVTFTCAANSITTIQALPTSVRSFSCNINPISTLPLLPDSLGELICNYTLITSLPSLPVTLTNLDCGHNSITALPVLPPTLRDLNCEYCNITGLPALPSSLFSFYCGFNLLTSLPPLPTTTLYYVHCENNLLTSLPEINFNLYSLDIDNNPGLTCFPRIDSIGTLLWSNTGITCLPNACYIGSATPSISNLPFCQPASGCNFYWNMYGNVYNDTNSNCLNDTFELKLKNIPLLLDSGGTTLQEFVTNNEGYYSFETGSGNYSVRIDTTGLPFDITCPVTNSYSSTLTAVDSTDADLDFGVHCRNGYLDLISNSIATSGFLRPGRLRTLFLNAGDFASFYGVSCAYGISGTVQAILESHARYSSPAIGAIAPSIIADDTLTWNVADFSTINPSTDFNIIFYVDSNAIAGDTICVSLSISTASSENNNGNNFIENCFPISNSNDPNTKEVYPEGIVDSSVHSFTFTINFQNTGNSYAENIFIIDTIDDDLDANTFVFLSASHPVDAQLLPGNILRFSFPNIMLPDSLSDEPGSHGFVQYRINRKDSVYPNMDILNTAQIYFDLNPPVPTNTTYSFLNFDCNRLLAMQYSDSSACTNSDIQFSNNVALPVNITTDWYVDSVLSSSSPLFTFSSQVSGNYHVMLVAGYDGCSASEEISVEINSPPQPDINITGDSLWTDSGSFFQWFFGDSLITGAVFQFYIAQQTGWYHVSITDVDGCMSNSDSLYFNFLDVKENRSFFAIVPDPVVNNQLEILSYIVNQNNDASYSITDEFGRIVFGGKINLNMPHQNINLPDLSGGLYIFLITSGEKIYRQKFSVLK